MILKVIENIFKPVKVKDESGAEIIVDKLVGSKVTKMEYPSVISFKEMLNSKNNVYKKRCMLNTEDGWIVVRHSWDELQQMKSHRNIIGFK
jgi:hypothetical protein